MKTREVNKAYDQLNDRRIDYIIDIPFLLLYFIKQLSRYHVAVCLFGNKSQMTSKCGKNISDTIFNYGDT